MTIKNISKKSSLVQKLCLFIIPILLVCVQGFIYADTLRTRAYEERVNGHAAAVEEYEHLVHSGITPEQRSFILTNLKRLRDDKSVEQHLLPRIEFLIEQLSSIDVNAEGITNTKKLQEVVIARIRQAGRDSTKTEKDFWIVVYYCYTVIEDYEIFVGEIEGAAAHRIEFSVVEEIKKVYKTRHDFNAELLTFGLLDDLTPTRHAGSIYDLGEFSGRRELSLLPMPEDYHNILENLQVGRCRELSAMARYADLPRINWNMRFSELRGEVNIVTFTSVGQEVTSIFQASLGVEGANFIVTNSWTRNLVAENRGGVKTLSIKSGYVLDKDEALTLARFEQPLMVNYNYWMDNNGVIDKLMQFRIPCTVPLQILNVVNNKINTHRALHPKNIAMPAYAPADSNYTVSYYARSVIDPPILRLVSEADTVVKPAEAAAGHGVRIFSRGDVDGVMAHLERLVRNNFALVEERILNPRIILSDQALDWNIRLVLVRTQGGSLEPVGMFIRAGEAVVNIARGARVLDFNWALAHLENDHHFSDAEIETARADLTTISRNAIAACSEYGQYLCRTFYKAEPDSWPKAIGEESPFEVDAIAVDFLYDKKTKSFLVGEIQAAFAGQWYSHKLGLDIVTPTLVIAREKGLQHRMYVSKQREGGIFLDGLKQPGLPTYLLTSI